MMYKKSFKNCLRRTIHVINVESLEILAYSLFNKEIWNTIFLSLISSGIQNIKDIYHFETFS